MRALAIVAIVALGPSVIEARAADLRVDGPAIRGTEYVYEQVPVCEPGPFYGFCVPHYGPIGYPYYGPIGYRFIGRSLCLLARLSPLPNDADQNTGWVAASG